jgi:hypothetical protein
MAENLIASAPDAYAYPLVVKQLLTKQMRIRLYLRVCRILIKMADAFFSFVAHQG